MFHLIKLAQDGEKKGGIFSQTAEMRAAMQIHRPQRLSADVSDSLRGTGMHTALLSASSAACREISWSVFRKI